jgi:hypothetical protein
MIAEIEAVITRFSPGSIFIVDDNFMATRTLKTDILPAIIAEPGMATIQNTEAPSSGG